ncbi:MAG: DUF1700 domain-containing protein [Ruminococcaceae bacterium]|nr:DUF1700 domain-containing protein [Oscillospiraceae bacterium]
MRKQEFLDALRTKLSGLPKQDVGERLNFYGEMIDDRVEEGLSEEEAVLDIGSVEEIAAQIIADIPLTKIVKERVKPKRRLRAWEILFLALGSPIWLSLAVAAFAVIFSLYASLWAVIVSLWAVFASLAVCPIGSVPTCVIFAVGGNGASGVAVLAAGIVCLGLSIFMLYGCKAATKGALILTKKMAISIKNRLIKRGEA